VAETPQETAENITVIPTKVIFEYIDSTAGKFGVDPTLAKQIFLGENFQKTKDGRYVAPVVVDTTVVSPKGATGAMQVMPTTHEGLVKQGYLPAGHTMDRWESQVDAGLAAIKAKQREHKTTDPFIIAAAYNGGNAAAQNAREGKVDALPAETREYLVRITNAGLQLGGSLPISPTTGTNKKAPVSTPVPIQPSKSTDPVERGIQAYQQNLEDNQVLFQSLINDITRSTEEAVGAKTREAKAIMSAGSAAATDAGVTAAIDAATIRNKERILGILNLDTRKETNIISSELARQQSIDKEIVPLKSEITDRMSVGFFDNPLQWMINATILPGQVERYNQLAGTYNDSLRRVRVTQDTVSRQQSIDVAGTADLFARRAVIAGNAEIAKATAKAESASAEAAGMKAAAALQIARLAGSIGDDTRKGIEFGILLEQRRETGKAKAEDQAILDEINRGLGVISSAVGAPGMSVKALQSKPKEIQNLWDNARRSRAGGSNFSESLFFVGDQGSMAGMRATGRAEFADVSEKLLRLVKDESFRLQENWKQLFPLSSKAPTQKELFEYAAQKLERDLYNANNANMFAVSNLNPYKINHTSTVRAWQGDPNNPVFKWVDGQIAKGVKIDDEILFETLRKQVTAKQVFPQMAAQALAEYYNTAVGRNNIARDFEFLSLRPQENYIVLPIRSKVKVDLTDRTALENFFTRNVITAGMEAQFPMAEQRVFVAPSRMPDKVIPESERIFTIPEKNKNNQRAGAE
jgi:hypothetical protein